MKIEDSIAYLEKLKEGFELFETIEIKTKVEDVEALTTAIETMKNVTNLFNALSLFNKKNDITNKKSTCHCCLETEKLTDVLGLNLCPTCLEVFNSYRKIIDRLR